MYTFIKDCYDTGKISLEKLTRYTKVGFISAEEFEEISGMQLQ